MAETTERAHRNAPYPDSVRLRARQLVSRGASVSAVSRELGPDRDTISRWCRNVPRPSGRYPVPQVERSYLPKTVLIAVHPDLPPRRIGPVEAKTYREAEGWEVGTYELREGERG